MTPLWTPSGAAPIRTAATPRTRFIDVVWWVNQELLHHGAEIALLRDLYRESTVSLD